MTANLQYMLSTIFVQLLLLGTLPTVTSTSPYPCRKESWIIPKGGYRSCTVELGSHQRRQCVLLLLSSLESEQGSFQGDFVRFKKWQIFYRLLIIFLFYINNSPLQFFLIYLLVYSLYWGQILSLTLEINHVTSVQDKRVGLEKELPVKTRFIVWMTGRIVSNTLTPNFLYLKRRPRN